MEEYRELEVSNPKTNLVLNLQEVPSNLPIFSLLSDFTPRDYEDLECDGFSFEGIIGVGKFVGKRIQFVRNAEKDYIAPVCSRQDYDFRKNEQLARQIVRDLEREARRL